MKPRLFAPGPTWIPTDIYQAMQRPHLHHRSDEFREVFDRCSRKLKKILKTKVHPVYVGATGSGGMEMAITNYAAAGDTIVSVNGGVFGARWKHIADSLGIGCNEVVVPPGKTASLSQLEKALKQSPDAKILATQLCETSSTVIHPVAEFNKLAKQKNPDIVTVVDAISAFGTMPMTLPDLNADVVIISSQKALMLPPGLSILILSEQAKKLALKRNAATFYLNIRKHLEAYSKSNPPWTPPITIILGMDHSLDLLLSEGLDQVFSRYQRLASICRSGLEAMGFTLLVKNKYSTAVTAAIPPKGIDANKLKKHLLDKFNIYIAGGQGELQGKIIRVAHMGYSDQFDVLSVLSAIELALKDLGSRSKIGKGLLGSLKECALLSEI